MTPLAHLRRFRYNRLVAVFALVAFFFATTAYVVHGFKHELPLSQHATAHCDLCLHFSGTAGTPDHQGFVGKPPVGAYFELPVVTPRFTSWQHPTNRLPRAPPALT